MTNIVVNILNKRIDDLIINGLGLYHSILLLYNNSTGPPKDTKPVLLTKAVNVIFKDLYGPRLAILLVSIRACPHSITLNILNIILNTNPSKYP
jgi:hypothetical protein